jgi:hypothetical protein
VEGPTCGELFESWIRASEPRPSTINRWRAVFLDLQSHFADRSARSITQEEFAAWKDRLITKERSAQTVSDIWLVAARTVFGWAVKERRVPANPFVGITVKVPRKKRLRETDAFTAHEARTILKAALAITNTRTPFAAAWPLGTLALRLHRRAGRRNYPAAGYKAQSMDTVPLHHCRNDKVRRDTNGPGPTSTSLPRASSSSSSREVMDRSSTILRTHQRLSSTRQTPDGLAR